MNIVLLHGLAGSGKYFQALEERLQAIPGTGTLAPDLLGFGKNYISTGPFSLENHLRFLSEQINSSFGQENVVLLGHSMGGVLGLLWTQEHTNRVKSIILLNTPLGTTRQEVRDGITHAHKKFLDWGYMLLKHRAVTHIACNILCKHNGMRFLKPLKPAYIPDNVFADYRLHSWNSLSQTLETIILSHPALPILEKIRTTPVLNITGCLDSPLMRKHPLQPNITHRELDGGHNLLLEKPEEVFGAIQNFISSTL